MIKSINDTIEIPLPSLAESKKAAYSLKDTLYSFPVTLLLQGDLGTGKTTFVQAFAEALGIQESITSPTYALEQRYPLEDGKEFLHLDLYRLTSEQTVPVLQASEQFTGIRCIEWPQRIPDSYLAELGPTIHLSLKEEGTGRQLTCTFSDISLPTHNQIQDWRQEFQLPSNVIDHCETVAAFSDTLTMQILQTSRLVRPYAATRAAKLHDLFRFVDFKPQGNPHAGPVSEKTLAVWERWKQRYAGLNHEQACAQFLEEQRFPDIASIVRTHGLMEENAQRHTIEQQLLFYADKRVMHDRVVSLEERFHDLVARYANGVINNTNIRWLEETKLVEQSLFPDGISV